MRETCDAEPWGGVIKTGGAFEWRLSEKQVREIMGSSAPLTPNYMHQHWELHLNPEWRWWTFWKRKYERWLILEETL